ncbi:Xylanase inhibitor, N-terminal [Dillenia turbinata]|uniref:Xylanase inhibitor, N-terminal n=1 Tax=Dillenia turbinata TaxID=194707 RepID=A0AAN8YQ75_9MAGN
MDPNIKRRIILVILVLNYTMMGLVAGSIAFQVKHKYGGRQKSLSRLSALKAHDVRRHGRMLSALELPLGGNGAPSETGLYYTRIGIGVPSNDYYVQVDTGSDLLWVNCVGCKNCPQKSDLVELTQYNPQRSTTSELITCDQEFCISQFEGQPLPGCTAKEACPYRVTYGDGSTTTGYYVQDYIHFVRVSNSNQTQDAKGTAVFGCGAIQSGGLGSSSTALDGLIGFGQANSSVLSQLASSGKVKKIFSHCLDSIHGGGIFAIGEVVQPKVGTTPLVPKQAHYNVNMKAIEVGGDVLQLPTDVFETGDHKGTIIDSGTTLAYVPDAVYQQLMTKIFSEQPNLKLETVQKQFTCFKYSANVDGGFPAVTFHFEDSLTLTAYPHEYLFENEEDQWCVGWQNGGLQSKDGKYITLLGDLVLSNKLVVYDLVNQVIGWTEWNCSSSIKVKDDQSQATYSVHAEDLGSSSTLTTGKVVTLCISLMMLLHIFNSNSLDINIYSSFKERPT